ncbi:MAG: flagellar hook capping protein [Fimbriimonadaceae bacterium]|nr:flagellar hook capping protein [Fimbriimonadaceae bacterium]
MDPLSGASSATYVTGPPPEKRSSELNMATFLRLLTVQLSTQNPLEPMNDRDFFAQLAQLGQVQGMETMQTAMAAQQAATLVGKTVVASDVATGGIVEGKVESVKFRAGKPSLVVATARGPVEVELGFVQEVKA